MHNSLIANNDAGIRGVMSVLAGCSIYTYFSLCTAALVPTASPAFRPGTPGRVPTLLRRERGCGRLSASLCHAYLLTASGLRARSPSVRAMVRDCGELGSIPSGSGWMAYRDAASVPNGANPGRDAGAAGCRSMAAVKGIGFLAIMSKRGQ